MKRAFDVTVAMLGLFLLAPVFAFVAARVLLEDGPPVFYRQVRIGRDGAPFRIVKFRSMRPEDRGPELTAAGDPRVTRVGRFLRRTKLDELPQLWNVLRGDMSLVGPRPEVPRYVATYTDRQREVLRVRPGITGAAQLEGVDEERALAEAEDPERLYRDVLLPRKLEIDLRYSREACLRTDLRILLGTLPRLWHRDPSGRGSHAG